MKNWE